MVDGDPQSGVLIVGMSPGRDEIRLDKPFMGASGRFLWSLLKRYAQIDRADCYIVNTIGEWPGGKTGDVLPEQLARYWDVFDAAICQSKARVVLLLGKSALYRFTGITGGIEDWRGYIVPRSECRPIDRVVWRETVYKTKTRLHNKGDVRLVKEHLAVAPTIPGSVSTILPTLHPAGVMRSGFASAPALLMDIKRVGRALRGELRSVRERFLEHPAILLDGPVAADIETGGIDGGINRIGIANREYTYTLRWDSRALAVTKEELSVPGRVNIFHNAAFDVPRLESAGCPVAGQLWDTMLAAALVQPDLYKGLNQVGSFYLDCERWKHESEEAPAKYNAFDASRTLELYWALRAELVETGQLDLFENTIMPAVRTLASMSHRGIRVDKQKRVEWQERLRREFDECMAQWQETTGLSVRAGKQVNDYLYGTLGLPVKFKKYGGTTSEEVALRELAFDYPEHADKLNSLIRLRELGKDLKTYAEVGLSPDGCVHPNYLPANKDSERRDPDGKVVGKGLAGTWRITAKNPNIQNQPKEARRMYIPSPGRVLVAFDYNQLEARILAAVSGDSTLDAAIREGLHTCNMALLGVDKTRAKNAFYGWSYMAGAPTLVKTFHQYGYDVPHAECQKMLLAFDRRFHVAKAWRERRAAEAEELFYVTNAFGLRRYFQKRGCGPAAANHEMQSDGAIIMWSVLPAVGRACDTHGGALLATIHDEVLCELPYDKDGQPNQTAIEEIKAILEQEWPQIKAGFKNPVSVKIGMNWGEMQEV